MTDYVGVDVEVVRETKLAVLLTDGDDEFWVPKSVMVEWPDVGDTGEAVIAEWFAIKEGLV